MVMFASLRALLCLGLGQALAAETPLGFKPNFLFLFPDQWRSDWDGLRSFYQRGETPELNVPNLRKYAESGARFEHAYVPSPLCTPSRACLASGREYDWAGAPDNNSPVKWKATFFSQLQKAGYHTMTTGRFGPPYKGRPTKLGFSDAFDHGNKATSVMLGPQYEDYGKYLNSKTVTLKSGKLVNAFVAHYSCVKMAWGNKHEDFCDGSFPDELYFDNWVSQKAIELLERKPAGVPWFLWVTFVGPHDPYQVTANMAGSVTKRTWPQPHDTKERDRCQNQLGRPGTGGRCNYAAQIENLDKLFGLVVGKVEELGEMDKTLVVISSDHGDMLGDHGQFAKTTPWESSVSVPLIVFGGSDSFSIPAGSVRSAPTATLDLAGTFMDYAGADPAVGMTTTSLRNVLEGKNESVRPFVASGLGNWRMAVEEIGGTWYKFICCKGLCKKSPSTVPKAVSGWTQALYDIKKDRFDMKDLSKSFPHIVNIMRKRLPGSFGCAQSKVTGKGESQEKGKAKVDKGQTAKNNKGGKGQRRLILTSSIV